jgi:hypothetical protein
MTWNDFVYELGDLLEATFAILPPLENIPNAIFTAIIFGGFIYWLMQLNKYKKEAKRTGGIE